MESHTEFFKIYSSFIFNESCHQEQFKDLGPDQPILRPLLPSMVKNICQFMMDPHFTLDQVADTFYFNHFDHLSVATKLWPNLTIKKTLPYEVYQFINSAEDKVIFDSQNLGATLVSKSEITLGKLSGSCAVSLEPFMQYAFSNDLWNAQGKWPRFHARLLTLFNNKSLLIHSHGPGHYQLKKSAKKLENAGICGDVQDNSFTLILPWSYPLRALNELEKIISQEL